VKIFISRHGQRYGPYAVEELNQQLDAGMFDLGDFASTDGGHSWSAIRSIPGVVAKPFAVQIETPGDLLVIRYRGRVAGEEVDQCAQEVEAALQKLSHGFRLLVDLTDLESMSATCAPQLEKIMDQCNAAGVTLVARAIPDQRRDIGLQIMSYFHYGPGVRIVTCAGVDEARRALSEFGKPTS
jgi:anti-anti-sigma regulatory factor